MAYVRARWQASFSVGGMTKWLHRQGFSYKKPNEVPHKFDADKQQQFIDDYQSLKNSCNALPVIQILLQSFKAPLELLAEGYLIKRLKDHFMKTFTNTIGFGRHHFPFGVVYITSREVELIVMFIHLPQHSVLRSINIRNRQIMFFI